MKSNGFESFWDEKEIDTLKEITERYEKVKGLFLYAEEIDNKITFLPASNEFRAAFDHLMRVFAFKTLMTRRLMPEGCKTSYHPLLS